MTKIYIYDQKKAGFYMYNGVFPLDVQVHRKTGNRFFVFSKEKTQHLYEQWQNELTQLYDKGDYNDNEYYEGKSKCLYHDTK